MLIIKSQCIILYSHWLEYRTTDATKADVDLGQLVTSSVSGWQGPYLNYEHWASDDNWLVHPVYDLTMIHAATDANWSDATPSAAGTKCTSSSTSCSYYACFRSVPDDLKLAIERKVDGDSGANNTGLIRYTLGAAEYICKKGMQFPVANAVN